jgi:hypothetical protein
MAPSMRLPLKHIVCSERRPEKRRIPATRINNTLDKIFVCHSIRSSASLSLCYVTVLFRLLRVA